MKKTAFTIIEVLLALFLTAVLISILGIVLNVGMRTHRQAKDSMDIAAKAQLIIGQMTRELRSAMIQSEYIPFGMTGNSISFMSAIEEVDDNTDTDLCEVGYSLSGTNLLKRHIVCNDTNIASGAYEYPSLVDFEAPAVTEVFCENVEIFNLSYLHPTTGVYCAGSSWTSSTTQMPLIIEVSVRIRGQYSETVPRTFTSWIYLPYSTNNA